MDYVIDYFRLLPVTSMTFVRRSFCAFEFDPKINLRLAICGTEEGREGGLGAYVLFTISVAV